MANHILAKKPLRHVAIIMDGNGRWAKQRFLPRAVGHDRGAQVAKKIIEESYRQGINVLTLFAFGQDNQKRPQHEIRYLLNLFAEQLDACAKYLREYDIRLQVIGDYHRLDSQLAGDVDAAIARCQHHSTMTLVIALNYSGRWDIVNAINQCMAKNLVTPIDEKLLSAHLCLADLPEPDLLIRTSGEQRISNFMLWQFAYTELYFSKKYWPDFSIEDFHHAIDSFTLRERRFGMTPEQVKRIAVQSPADYAEI